MFKAGSVRQAHVRTELMANLEKSGFGVAQSELDDSSFSQQDSAVDMNAINANTEQMQHVFQFVQKLQARLKKSRQQKAGNKRELAYMQISSELLHKNILELNQNRQRFKREMASDVKLLHGREHKLQILLQDLEVYEEQLENEQNEGQQRPGGAPVILKQGTQLG